MSITIISNKLKAKSAAASSVKSLLHDLIGGFEPAREQLPIHASALTKPTGFCPREIVLMTQLKKKQRPEWLPTALRVTFDSGQDMQTRITTYLRDYLIGDWKCSQCGALSEWSSYPRHMDVCCVVAGDLDGGAEINHSWSYKEPRFLEKVSGVSGGVDLFVKLPGDSKARVVEVKIMKGDDFEALVAPLAEHRLRTNLYLRLVEFSGGKRWKDIDLTKASVLYVMRGHGKKDEKGEISPFKEFVIQRDDTETEVLMAAARIATRAIEIDGMAAGICQTATCARAKTCPVVKECFSGKYPPTLTWSGAVGPGDLSGVFSF